MSRPEYSVNLIVNERKLTRVIIDQHYKESHTDLDDMKILELVTTLDGQTFPIESTRGEYEYFKVEPVFLEEKPYRIILVICINDDFLGVVNAFRVSRRQS